MKDKDNELFAKVYEDVYEDCVHDIDRQTFSSDEEKLAYLIIKKRFSNLCKFLKKQKQKYKMLDDDVAELKELWFLYNDLKELNYIGTDIYSNVLFVRHKVPFLYRSVGKDSSGERVLDSCDSDEIGRKLIKECLEQIKSGGKGKLFSYSKCFGKMLFKYANIIDGSEETTIELRKNTWINSICDENGNHLSLQKYIRKNLESKAEKEEIEIPCFLIDMSNARGNKVENLKLWLDTYLGKQEYVKRFEDIYDPIGDAEVVANFTGDLTDSSGKYIMCEEVCRYPFNIEEFCSLLYKYALTYAKEIKIEERFNRFIDRTLKTLPDPETNEYFKLYQRVKNNESYCAELLKNIDWENEKIYMPRVKAEKDETTGKIPMIDVYKRKDAESKSSIWKEIVFEALRGKYEYMNGETLH